MKKLLIVILPILVLGSCSSMLKSMGGASQSYVVSKDDQLAARIDELKKSVQELNAKSEKIDVINAKIDALTVKVDLFSKGLESIEGIKTLVAELQALTSGMPLETFRRLDAILQKAIADIEAGTPVQK